MRVISFLSAMISLSALLKTAYDRLYSEDGSDEPAGPLKVQFEKTVDSMEKFLQSIYIVFGSSVLGMIVDPPDPLWKADQIYNEFTRNYREFLAEFRNLISLIRNGGDDVKNKLGDEWVTLDSVGNLIEKGKVEWDEVAAKGIQAPAEPVLNNQRRFNNHLIKRLREFLKDEMDVNDFEPIDMVSSALKDHEILQLTGARLMQFIGDSESRRR